MDRRRSSLKAPSTSFGNSLIDRGAALIKLRQDLRQDRYIVARQLLSKAMDNIHDAEILIDEKLFDDICKEKNDYDQEPVVKLGLYDRVNEREDKVSDDDESGDDKDDNDEDMSSKDVGSDDEDDESMDWE